MVASQRNASVAAVCAIVVVAAIIGDSIGYGIGRRYGDRVLHTRVFRHRQMQVERAEAYLGGAEVPPCSLGASSRS